ncbi:hypothetical protein Lal_00019864 [Lupinus albus]|uniref:Putative START-like domain-containing protein n=1 Tax=Lupinus albus TaxID=3870 RepID=A0A6A4R259_LUPAL|nr:putative START-like domain-containing protein [Lupinus albus]KAF1899733.1 hypothetical protein Lal_00019864 [Lupinus albus]
MSLTGKITREFDIVSNAEKFFHIIAKQLHNVQNITDHVHHGKVHEGDWHTLGSVRHWTYVLDGEVTEAKEKFEEVDEEKKRIVVKIFDGDVGKKYKLLKITLELNDDKNNDGDGAVIKWSVDYEKINKDIAVPYGYLGYLTKITEDIDAHILKP